MNFPNEYFDVIVCVWTFVYSNEIQKALAEIYRVAKNGSKIFISFDSFSKKNNNSLEDIYIDNSNAAFIEYVNNLICLVTQLGKHLGVEIKVLLVLF